jgi:N-methylhydantoinase A
LLRYEGQGSELAITWPGDAQAAQSAFAQAHQALNGFTLEAEVELVTLRVEAESVMPAPTRHSLAKGNGAEPIGRQIVHEAAGSVEASVYDRAALGAGDRLAGPAIVTQLDATTLVPRGWHAEALGSSALLLRRG